MVSEARIDYVADRLVDLDLAIVVSDNAARRIAAAVPAQPVQTEKSVLEAAIRTLADADEIEVVDLRDGECALE